MAMKGPRIQPLSRTEKSASGMFDLLADWPAAAPWLAGIGRGNCQMVVADVLPLKILAEVSKRNTSRHVAKQFTEAAHGADPVGIVDLLRWAISDKAISAGPP
jgi:hypothetical protein